MDKRNKASRKPKGPAQRRPKAKLVKAPTASVFLYTSVCCTEPALKKACVKDVDVELKDRAAHLGSWRCTRCKRKCKVTRSLNKEGLVVTA